MLKNFHCIVQARMGSSRLPEKVMMNLNNDKRVIDYVISQLKSSKFSNNVIIATTNGNEDNIIYEYVTKKNVPCFRGSSLDVLDRYYQCAKKYDAKNIIRITCDNPLIDPNIVDHTVSIFNEHSFDYVSNCIIRTYPYGTETEVFTFESLKIAWQNAKLPSEREHVTPYFKNNTKIFQIHNVLNDINLSNLRWTLDSESDLKLIKTIISKIDKDIILIEDILDLFSREPEIVKINQI